MTMCLFERMRICLQNVCIYVMQICYAYMSIIGVHIYLICILLIGCETIKQISKKDTLIQCRGKSNY